MIRVHGIKRLAVCLLGLGLALTVNAGGDVRELEWDDLMPEDWNPFSQLEALYAESGSLVDGTPEADALMERFLAAGRAAPVVSELNGQRVKLPGFVVPLEFEDKEIAEFLLVPYFGACIHVPPPPANQIVYVKAPDAPVRSEVFMAVWVTGTLTTDSHYNDVGDAGYTLQASKIEPYQQ